MLTLPTLPTDSIYKFLFVSGLIFLLAAFYFMHVDLITVSNSYIKIDSLSTKSFRNYDRLKRLSDEILAFSKKTDKRLYIGEIDSLIKVYHKEREAFLSGDDEYMTSSHKFKTLSNNIDANFRSYDTLLKIGWLFTVVGLIGWIYYIQIPQNKILKLQIALMEADLKKKPVTARKHFEPTVLPRPQVRNTRT